MMYEARKSVPRFCLQRCSETNIVGNKPGQRDLAALLIADKLALSCKHSSLSIKALPSVLVSFTPLFLTGKSKAVWGGAG